MSMSVCGAFEYAFEMASEQVGPSVAAGEFLRFAGEAAFHHGIPRHWLEVLAGSGWDGQRERADREAELRQCGGGPVASTDD